MSIRYSTDAPSAQQVWELYNRLGWADFLKLSAEQLLRAMQQSWHVLYVYNGDQLIGTGRVVSDGVINAYLCGLGVMPEYRGRGIGTEISRRLVAQCKEYNLHIQFFCKEQLVPFYENMGFEVFAVGMKVPEGNS